MATYEEHIAEIIDESPASHLLTIPGVWEAICEDEATHNEALRRCDSDAQED